MNLITQKILIMFVLTTTILIFIIFIFLLYKTVIRPWIIRLFCYKKVLYTAQLILQANKDDKDGKVKSIINAGIKDPDLIMIAEEEIKKAKLKALSIKKNNKLNKISFTTYLKNLWRKNNGKEKRKSVQSDIGPKTPSSTGETKKETGGEIPSSRTTTTTTSRGAIRPKEDSKINKGSPGPSTVQIESSKPIERRYKYFS